MDQPKKDNSGLIISPGFGWPGAGASLRMIAALPQRRLLIEEAIRLELCPRHLCLLYYEI